MSKLVLLPDDSYEWVDQDGEAHPAKLIAAGSWGMVLTLEDGTQIVQFTEAREPAPPARYRSLGKPA